MKLPPRSILLPLLLCPAMAIAAPAQDPHGDAHAAHSAHAAHAGHAPAVVAPDHMRYEPDAPLMEGMRRMSAVVEALEHARHGHLGAAEVELLAAEVHAAAAFMFAHCELPPEPDVALHGLLARLMAGAQALEADPADLSPAEQMRAAVEDYRRLFDDPAFPG